ncbi:glycoside hydrolase family 97 C-terminal domain-containing protein [Mucilaginibacter metallidurans]|uniref:glycoside hydrolase family 97 C-terminal domain-containing protein n=1 Tax=Mucilaginibacter sp. P4 TaxID=3383180 RepID=UPI001FCCA2FB|nr:glycoside hydrolase family 97 C-terminal domain-containing protein [Mucilaginibacter gossypii]
MTTTRRSGKDWFVGTITNNDPRSLKLALDFLPKGRKYLATLCADNAKVSTVTHVGMEKLKVDSRTVLDVSLAASGGQAIYLTPEINP